MEQVMFPKPEIANLLEKFVRVRLYTDDTYNKERSAAYRLMLDTRFHTGGALPFYAILTPENKLIAFSEGSTADVDKFAAFLKYGLSVYEEIVTVQPVP